MSKIKCLTCGTTKAFPTQGRHIDGSWAEDYTLPKKKWGGWVCSWNCYEKLLPDSWYSKLEELAKNHNSQKMEVKL